MPDLFVPTAQQCTKLWRVIEAMEGMITATEPKATQKELGNAREEMFNALRDFLIPAIRVIDTQAEQPAEEEEEMPPMLGPQFKPMDVLVPDLNELAKR